MWAVYPEQATGQAVFTRPMAWLAAHMLQLKEQGVRVVSETDDNYLSDANQNWFLKAHYLPDSRDEHARSMCTADAVIFSTGYLRDRYHELLKKHFPGLPLPEFHVCRNHVDADLLPEPVPREGKLRVGYMGSDSHVWDVELIYPALHMAKQEGCEIIFWGINPGLINPKHFRHKWDWDALEYRHVPWTMHYHGCALPFDIGLCPLIVNEHTLCKSDIKIMEYAISGAASVAQNCLVYNRTFRHNETALMAGSPGEFVAQTLALIRDEKLRERIAAEAKQYVLENRILQRHGVDEWRAAIEG